MARNGMNAVKIFFLIIYIYVVCKIKSRRQNYGFFPYYAYILQILLGFCSKKHLQEQEKAEKTHYRQTHYKGIVISWTKKVEKFWNYEKALVILQSETRLIHTTMSKDNNNSQLTDYEKYCQMMAQQQEEDMDELISGDMSEEAPEGVFVRGH